MRNKFTNILITLIVGGLTFGCYYVAIEAYLVKEMKREAYIKALEKKYIWKSKQLRTYVDIVFSTKR